MGFTYKIILFNPSWEANSDSASQEVLHLLWNPKVHNYAHKSHSIGIMQCQMSQH